MFKRPLVILLFLVNSARVRGQYDDPYMFPKTVEWEVAKCEDLSGVVGKANFGLVWGRCVKRMALPAEDPYRSRQISLPGLSCAFSIYCFSSPQGVIPKLEISLSSILT